MVEPTEFIERRLGARKTARLALLPKMPERDLQMAVVDLAQLLKWQVAHFRPAMTKAGNWVTPVAADGKGFPDLVLVRDRVLFVELKRADGRLTPEQADWAARLLLAGAEHYIWKPLDWYDGTIENVLRKGAS